MERYVIHVTKLCQCDCAYCYEQDKTSTYTWEEVKSLIDNIVKYNKDKTFQIEYLGGEPLLAFDLIKKSTAYLEDIDSVKVQHYAITTNGTILNDEIIQWLKENPKVSWYASMDGTKFMNQFRVYKTSRINTYEDVIKNYSILLKEIGSHRIGIHMVTHPFNIGYLSKGIDHLYKLGVRSIGVGTVESTIKIDNEYCQRYIKELDTVSKRICNGDYNGLSIDVLNYIKPRSDTRYYIKDDTGKVIAESYGRTTDDITKQDIYNAVATFSRLGDTIQNIRETVYYNHQDNLKKNI
jgi:sulfatase maturation enzyme AslB (radical SAM superfamily)